MMQLLSVMILAVGTFMAITLLIATPLFLLWNWLMPLLFGLPALTWMQAWGLLLLCGLLFKNIDLKT